jgi:hypothetical protein
LILHTCWRSPRGLKKLQFANRTAEDVKMLHRIDEVADLMQALENLPEGKLLKEPFDSVSPIP